jgi:hypothetical protein
VLLLQVVVAVVVVVEDLVVEAVLEAVVQEVRHTEEIPEAEAEVVGLAATEALLVVMDLQAVLVTSTQHMQLRTQIKPEATKV